LVAQGRQPVGDCATFGRAGREHAREESMITTPAARPVITLAETAELVACLVTAHGPQFLHVDGRYGLSALLAMEPLTVHAAVALTLLDDTNRAVALSLAGHWALPENVASPVVQFAIATLPEAMATAEAGIVYARQRHADIGDSTTSHACDDLLAVIDAVDRNLRAGRRMVGATAPRAHVTSNSQPVQVPVTAAGTVPAAVS
jgi:hypothetical protein